MHVVATAGHVDHGKSTLVRALTGTDPDRLAEEKRRGLTIDLGFATSELPSGREVAFVDVPGHVRFIRNMLAGVGAVDACLFVVAATEGWKPQSEEHLRILGLLGVPLAVVALTKCALVDDPTLAAAREQVATRTSVPRSPRQSRRSRHRRPGIVEVDVPAGQGIAELVAALDRALADLATAPDRGRARLWVDRSFTVAGAGTVVTGTLAGGTLAVDDEVEVVPAGLTGRIRGLQSAHRSRTALGPGHRVAVNLARIEHGQVRRGDALVHPGRWHRSDRVDATLHVLAALDHPVSRRGAHLLYLGSGEHPVRLRVLGPEAIEPGGTGLVRLHLPRPLPLLPGDRYVLREAGRDETVGGGEVLDVDPVLPAARARPDRSVDRVVAERRWVDAALLERLTGEAREPAVGRWVVDPRALHDARAGLLDAVANAGPLGLDVAPLDERERAVLDLLTARGDLVVDAGRARGAGAGDPLARHPYLAALEASPFAPPSPEEAGADRREVWELVRRGDVVEHDGAFFAAAAVAEAGRTLAALLAETPDGVTVGEVRAVLGTTRKHAVPLLGALDARGVTRRRGDKRVPGPRLPTAGEGSDAYRRGASTPRGAPRR